MRDCGDLKKYSSIAAMQNDFERIDVENDEYEAWDANGVPLSLSVQQPIWLRVEPHGLSEAARTRSSNRGVCTAFRHLCRSEFLVTRQIRTSIGCNPSEAQRSAVLQKLVAPSPPSKIAGSAQPRAAVPPIPDLSQKPRAKSQPPFTLEIPRRFHYDIRLMLLTASNMAMCSQMMAMRVFTRRQTGT